MAVSACTEYLAKGDSVSPINIPFLYLSRKIPQYSPPCKCQASLLMFLWQA